ncbi:GAF domain-containing protein [Streptomyces sp. NPDC005423]|uniref:GAF domain-containing protein n=1 Tax=Streptomyces sp. NPDC005423 TaxID=3155343 RepID=UPI0033AD6759
MGVPTGPTELMDEIARELGGKTGFAYAFVNPVIDSTQTFIGLHQPPANCGFVTVGRTMSRQHGWCPEVIRRKKGLPLPDVRVHPRFAGNHVVDAVGIRSYFGVPLLDGQSGVAWGTVCVIDPEPRPLSDARRLLDLVKEAGAEVLNTFTGAHPH